MGSCVSFSRSPPAPAADESQPQPQRAAAKVVSPDGSMALFAVPVTAREALAPAASSSAPPLFLCSADELGFEAPARALARHEALRPGQLYFALPAHMLRRPLSSKDMAALAVRAATALAAQAGLVAAGRSPPRRRRSKEGGAAGGARRRRQATARVAPVLVDVPDGAWKNDVEQHGAYTQASATVRDGAARAPEQTRKGSTGHRSVSRHRQMGSCVSRSGAMPAAATAEHAPAPAPTAKVVDIDGGAMAQFSAPVTAREALAATARGLAPSSHARFLCCSDELDFDAPVRALDARDALQTGQLYFALPISMLGRPLPAHEMAALAVKACAALGEAALAVTGAPSQNKSGASAAGDKQRRRQATGRVSPLVVVSASADVEWKSYDVHGGGHGVARMAVRVGDRTVGKSSQAVGYKGVAPRLASVQRLSVIIEAAS
ncbi:hypothetical protein U9M48_014789, partial [Paspalum notatum var. saurae]